MSDPLFAAAIALVFVAAFAGLEGFLVWWVPRYGARARRLTRRLALIAPGLPAPDLVASARSRGGWASGLAGVSRVEEFLQQSGRGWRVERFLGLSAGLFVVGVLVALALRLPGVLVVALSALGGFSPAMYLSFCRAARLRHFERQLPEVMDLISRALRAGHTLTRAMQLAGSELPAPAGAEFGQVVREVNFGVEMPAALGNLVRRVPSTDLNFFVIAVLIQRESGGNLAEVLGNISALIRERLKLFGRVQALSAEGRFSGLVLMGLPFFTGAVLFMVDREFVGLLWSDPLGLVLLKSALVLMVLGAVWMRVIVNIKV